jgi:hypothetical protein
MFAKTALFDESTIRDPSALFRPPENVMLLMAFRSPFDSTLFPARVKTLLLEDIVPDTDKLDDTVRLPVVASPIDAGPEMVTLLENTALVALMYPVFDTP